jgi:hypothetical protein
MGWFEATRCFIANKGEAGNFNKIAGAVGAALRMFGISGTVVSVFDDALDFVPGINIITVADNALWLYGAYALYRIWKIRRDANRPQPVRYR